jgi:hypothetical protein
MKYYYSGNVMVSIALYTCLGFLIGGFIGATIAIPLPESILRKGFALYLFVIAVGMLF